MRTGRESWENWERPWGSNGVNIAGLYVGRQEVGGKAIAMVNVDNDVPEKVMSELREIPHIQDLKFVKF